MSTIGFDDSKCHFELTITKMVKCGMKKCLMFFDLSFNHFKLNIELRFVED